ncbi:MAG: hypothetical protein UU14_C0028G0002 [Candidatus Roizmanbacteria bacterium GW2011_GWB1_40_7]|uniref:Uncharacterized protein n=1 Tax=Candidatus Roizmanbacteria bacterium GW2011_GWB1_40_7 TaxID=1618482 RepID=A0A0G0VHD2_9BACT|nr:MAG: hypothetical protein UU14_C0028G0002 [Candidatus Roizmanbacteria bacterium GW2011_GWB1_40_7]
MATPEDVSIVYNSIPFNERGIVIEDPVRAVLPKRPSLPESVFLISLSDEQPNVFTYTPNGGFNHCPNMTVPRIFQIIGLCFMYLNRQA